MKFVCFDFFVFCRLEKNGANRPWGRETLARVEAKTTKRAKHSVPTRNDKDLCDTRVVREKKHPA
jgi:hypothetical protein